MVRVPEPSLVRVPAVEVLIPLVLMVVLPDPPTVRAKPVPVIPPVRVRVPESELILAADPRVMAPETVLEPEILRRAPAELTPSLFKVRGSAVVMFPSI